ncbi:MAG: pyridoxamine 5'-phosphate oxidase family protein, partial [Armatimonadetes bacterium]|nr:pyridoxamine 5'-phosphate oxidase family protein [Armatimonadota bacterium]
SGYRAKGDSATFGMDASHRGGDRGFVRVDSETRLMFPDYAGNNHFNTIGNLILDPRAGLLFMDFATGSLLQLTGRATIDWDSDAVACIPGARRLVTRGGRRKADQRRRVAADERAARGGPSFAMGGVRHVAVTLCRGDCDPCASPRCRHPDSGGSVSRPGLPAPGPSSPCGRA